MSGDEPLVIGVDLFKPLVSGVPFSWSIMPLPTSSNTKPASTTVLPPGVSQDGIADDWKQVLEDNQRISKSAVCKLPDAILHLDTGDHPPVWIRPYPITPAYMPQAVTRFELWKERGWITRSPPNCRWNNPTVVAPKPDKDLVTPVPLAQQDIRMCENLRHLNKVLVDSDDYSLSTVQHILEHLGGFD